MNDEGDRERIRHERGRKPNKLRTSRGRKSKKLKMLDIDPAFDIIMRVKHREIRSAKFKVPLNTCNMLTLYILSQELSSRKSEQS